MADKSKQDTPIIDRSKDRDLIVKDGCLGYQKGANFKEVTNFVPECVGYVTKGPSSNKALGFLIKVTQAEKGGENENDHAK